MERGRLVGGVDMGHAAILDAPGGACQSAAALIALLLGVEQLEQALGGDDALLQMGIDRGQALHRG